MKYIIVVDKQPRSNPTQDKREYSIDIEELRVKGDIHDSLIIKLGQVHVVRRLSLSKYHVLSILPEPIKEPLPDLDIELFDGDNYIYLVDMVGNIFYAQYLNKNQFNDIFATRTEMNGAIEVSSREIELSVDKKFTNYSTTEEMNAAINIKANEINLELEKKVDEKTITGAYLILKINGDTSEAKLNADKIELTANHILNLIAGNDLNLSSKNITITSNNFKVDKNGYITATSGKVGGFTLGDVSFVSNISGLYNYNNYDVFHIAAMCLGLIYKNSILSDIDDVNEDGTVNSGDFVRIKKILFGETTNTKNVSGVFKINSKDPKNCISITKGDTLAVSIGVGGIDSHMINCENFICGYIPDGSDYTTDDFKGVTINGHTGEINSRVNGGENHTIMQPTGIGIYSQKGNVLISDEKIVVTGENPEILIDGYYPVYACHNLYDNSSGTTGTVTLSSSAANFSYLEIFYQETTNGYGVQSVKVYSPNGKTALLNLISEDSSNVRLNTSKATISGTSITRSCSQVNYAPATNTYDVNEIRIIKVIGYR